MNLVHDTNYFKRPLTFPKLWLLLLFSFYLFSRTPRDLIRQQQPSIWGEITTTTTTGMTRMIFRPQIILASANWLSLTHI